MSSAQLEILARQTWHRILNGMIYDVRQGEETITDILLLELASKLTGQSRIVKTPKPREANMGTDWEWWIGDSIRGWLRYAVQAKRIGTTTEKYTSLRQRVGPKGPKQIEVLTKFAKNNNAVPVYCFYNYVKRSCILEWHCPLQYEQDQLGCTVVPLPVVQAAVDLRGACTFAGIHSDSRTIPWRCLLNCPGIADAYSRVPNRTASQSPEIPMATTFGDWVREIGVGLYPALPPAIATALETGSVGQWDPEFYDPSIGIYPRRILVGTFEHRLGHVPLGEVEP